MLHASIFDIRYSISRVARRLALGRTVTQKATTLVDPDIEPKQNYNITSTVNSQQTDTFNNAFIDLTFQWILVCYLPNLASPLTC